MTDEIKKVIEDILPKKRRLDHDFIIDNPSTAQRNLGFNICVDECKEYIEKAIKSGKLHVNTGKII
jgi:hypothetical protein